MAISNLAYVRLILSVPHRVVLREALGTGDGTVKKFQTQLWPIIAETDVIRVDGVAKIRDTDYAIDNDTGVITFTVAPGDEKVVDADYTWAVFSDATINSLLVTYNDSVVPVLKDLIRALLSNTDLFIKYTIGMESVDRSKALDALKALLDNLEGVSSVSAIQAVIWTKSDVDAYERDVPWEDFLSSTPAD